MFQILLEAFTFCLAIFIGFRSYAKLTLFHRLILFQLMVYFSVYILSYCITLYQVTHHLTKNNQWLFNLYLFFEAMILAAAASIQLVSKGLKQFVYILVGLFFVVFVRQLKYNGFQVFANFACAAECMVLTVAFLLVLYEEFQRLDRGYLRSPVVFTSLAIVIFYGCNAPYFSFFNYLQKSHPKASEFLFHLIVDVLSNIRYLLLAISFWLIHKNQNLKFQDHAK